MSNKNGLFFLIIRIQFEDISNPNKCLKWINQATKLNCELFE
jgi:hypothetical protein